MKKEFHGFIQEGVLYVETYQHLWVKQSVINVEGYFNL